MSWVSQLSYHICATKINRSDKNLLTSAITLLLSHAFFHKLQRIPLQLLHHSCMTSVWTYNSIIHVICSQRCIICGMVQYIILRHCQDGTYQGAWRFNSNLIATSAYSTFSIVNCYSLWARRSFHQYVHTKMAKFDTPFPRRAQICACYNPPHCVLLPIWSPVHF